MSAFAEYLETRLHLVELSIDRDPDGALASAEFLEGEAVMLRRWSPARWRQLERGAPVAGLDRDGVAYLVVMVAPIALDPARRPLLIMADEIAATLLRAWFQRPDDELGRAA